MMNLLKLFVDIALWRRGPQDLPASSLLLVGTIVLYAGLSVVLNSLVPRTDEYGLVRMLLDTGFALAWTWALLAVFRRPSRFLQTATALVGTAVLLEPLLIGLQAVFLTLGENHPLALPAVFALLALLVWYLLINAHILRAALEVSLFVAILLTLLYAACSYFMTSQLLPIAT